MESLQIKMLLYVNILILLVREVALSSILTTPSRGCPTCTGKPVGLNVASLAPGEPCGVYTLSCAPGLRCEAPQEEPRPLRALLEGRGVCSNVSSTTPTPQVYPAGKAYRADLLMTLSASSLDWTLYMYIQLSSTDFSVISNVRYFFILFFSFFLPGVMCFMK